MRDEERDEVTTDTAPDADASAVVAWSGPIVAKGDVIS
jgi:hypothetical protein